MSEPQASLQQKPRPHPLARAGQPVKVAFDEMVRTLSAPEWVSEDPAYEARELLAFALGTPPPELLAQSDRALSEREAAALEQAWARRLSPEPTAYIVGAVEVRGVRFKVDRRGFIPRLDLWVVVDAALDRLPAAAQGRVLDLACGIGAAGICVGLVRPGLQIDLADLSPEAVELARENAHALIPGRGEAYAGDLFAALPQERAGSYVAITANPPWVPDGTELPAEIGHEPQVSFFGGPDGLDIVRRIVVELPRWLAPGGIYAQECDPSQVQKVLGLLARQGFIEGRAHRDAEGVERVVSARLPG